MLVALWDRILIGVYFTVFRPFLKWFLRRLTGKCELLRITYNTEPGARMTSEIEISLENSKIPAVRALVYRDDIDVDSAVKLIMKEKKVMADIHTQFYSSLWVCLSHIYGYRQLIIEVEALRAVHYSSDNVAHEEKLTQLWKNLKPGVHLVSRKSPQWMEIGFQGEDPQTDFRGMGILGLDQLLYFSTFYTETARETLLHSLHPSLGYSFAIVGIALTCLLRNLLVTGDLKYHFFNYQSRSPLMKDFHEVYCYLYYEFDIFWRKEEPKDIMEFGRVRDKFKSELLKKMKNRSVLLITSFQKMP